MTRVGPNAHCAGSVQAKSEGRARDVCDLKGWLFPRRLRAESAAGDGSPGELCRLSCWSHSFRCLRNRLPDSPLPPSTTSVLSRLSFPKRFFQIDLAGNYRCSHIFIFLNILSDFLLPTDTFESRADKEIVFIIMLLEDKLSEWPLSSNFGGRILFIL